MSQLGAEALRQRLADAREEAKILRMNGQGFSTDRVEGILKSIEQAAEDLLRFLPETEALLRGAKRAFLRRNFAAWEVDGYARRTAGGQREYCALVLPRVTPASIAREAGRRGERPAGSVEKAS